MLLDLVLVLVAGMREDVGNEVHEDITEEFGSEDHLGEVEAVVKGLEHVA